MRKTPLILAALAALAVTAASLAAFALSAPAQTTPFAQFPEDVAANGAHLYARTHNMGAPTLKSGADCLATKTGSNHRSSLWLCDVETYDAVPSPSGIGTIDKVHAQAFVTVRRRAGQYVLRRVTLRINEVR